MDQPKPKRTDRSSFHISARPGAVGLLMPIECKEEEADGFSLSSAADVRSFIHNLRQAAHVAFPKDFPHMGPMRGQVRWVPDPDPNADPN